MPRHNRRVNFQNQPTVYGSDDYEDQQPLLTFVGGNPIGDFPETKKTTHNGKGLWVMMILSLINLVLANSSWIASMKWCPVPPNFTQSMSEVNEIIARPIHGYDCIYYGLSGWFQMFSACHLCLGLLLFVCEKLFKIDLEKIHYVSISWLHTLLSSLCMGVYIIYRYFSHDHDLKFDLYHMHGSWFVGIGSALSFNLMILTPVILGMWLIPKIRDAL